MRLTSDHNMHVPKHRPWSKYVSTRCRVYYASLHSHNTLYIGVKRTHILCTMYYVKTSEILANYIYKFSSKTAQMELWCSKLLASRISRLAVSSTPIRSSWSGTSSYCDQHKHRHIHTQLWFNWAIISQLPHRPTKFVGRTYKKIRKNQTCKMFRKKCDFQQKFKKLNEKVTKTYA